MQACASESQNIFPVCLFVQFHINSCTQYFDGEKNKNFGILISGLEDIDLASERHSSNSKRTMIWLTARAIELYHVSLLHTQFVEMATKLKEMNFNNTLTQHILALFSLILLMAIFLYQTEGND